MSPLTWEIVRTTLQAIGVIGIPVVVVLFGMYNKGQRDGDRIKVLEEARAKDQVALAELQAKDQEQAVKIATLEAQAANQGREIGEVKQACLRIEQKLDGFLQVKLHEQS